MLTQNETETIDVSNATEQELIWACPRVHDADMLKALQALPLEAKIEATKIRIAEFIAHYNGNVYISFSGGKDSTVLAHIVHVLMGRTDIPLVFSNTGLEYAQIQKFAKKKGATFIRPEMQFNEVISTYGYPIISKEVAEAIYYARRIRSQNVNVERERERERARATLRMAYNAA